MILTQRITSGKIEALPPARNVPSGQMPDGMAALYLVLECDGSVQAWIGHAMHGDSWRLREQIFEAFPFLAGVVILE